MTRIWHNIFAAALIAGIVLAASHAQAQSAAVPQPSTRGFQPPNKQKALPPSTLPPPPALPGAVTTLQPADKTATDLGPTDELFDAINRGDIASARDALGRGADLSGRNILGMTPLDLSVDLSRNDITFLLLSLRGSAAPGAPPPHSASAQALLAQPAEPAAGKRPAKVAKQAAPPAPSMAALPPAPRQYAGPADSGAPNPQAGFLGFGRTQ